MTSRTNSSFIEAERSPIFAERSDRKISVLARPASTPENPYTGLLYQEITRLTPVEIRPFSKKHAVSGSFDIYHIHWPDGCLGRKDSKRVLFSVFLFLSLVWIQRKRGAKVVWTAHNASSHEGHYPALESLLWDKLIPMIDGVIYLSSFAQKSVEAVHPKLADIPSKVIFHGHYRSVYPNHLSRSECRQRLELPEHCTVLSFMGSIRPYKNVPHLLDQFSHIDSPDLKLLIAGSGKDETLLTEIRERASKDNRVRLDIGFVPAERLQVYLNASDLVVLPFQNILNSGSTLLALSFDRPVLVPDCGSLPELQSHLGEQWVKLYRGELTAQTIAEAVEWAKSISERPERHVDFRDYEWDQIAMNTAAFYYELLRI